LCHGDSCFIASLKSSNNVSTDA